LRREQVELGFGFETQTDTKAVVVVVTRYRSEGLPPQQAVAKTLDRIERAFALVILFAGEHDLVICTPRTTPLASASAPARCSSSWMRCRWRRCPTASFMSRMADDSDDPAH